MDELDKKIELLLYYKKGLLSAKEYLELISNDRIISYKYNGENGEFSITTDTGHNFKFRVYTMV